MWIYTIIANYDIDVKQPNCSYEFEAPPVDTAFIEKMYEYAILSQEEEQICETSCKDEEECVPVYTGPPTEMAKIYETFKSKIFCSNHIR